MIQVENITKQYALSKKQRKELQTNSTSISAVNNVSFTCQPGRVFSLLGPNGAGKTTLLRMVSTILTPSSGDIKVDDVSVIENPQEVRRRIGFLTGSTNLYDRLTPGEIVKYFADLHGMESSVFKERKEQLFEQLNIMNSQKNVLVNSLQV
jgi:sodium transport system ATP-binding protein